MSITVERNTKETQIRLKLDLDAAPTGVVNTGVPFFNHMLNAMAFHGGFFLEIEATGDLEVDPHHLVEDVGLVLGDAFFKERSQRPAVLRYSHTLIPMDEALSEVVIDVCNRPYWVYRADFPQAKAGEFDLALVREFIIALANKAQINLHAHCRYGENAHHMVESLFKALGKALAQAYTQKPGDGATMSTKGII